MREKLERLMREAGELILSASNIKNVVSEKEGTANFVTAYDVKVQRMLRSGLLELRPGSRFVGEEEDAQDDVHQGEVFIVDPIDGTTNFIKGCNASAVSVAMLRDGEPVLGAVYDPYRDEFFYAEKGMGATCNNVPLHVADEDLSQSLVCFGTSPYNPELIPQTFALAQRLVQEGLDLRRSGSAVIDLCQVARGSAGLMFEMRLCPWDHAAAAFIVTEAGGKVSQLDGSPMVYDRPCSAVAGTPKAWEDFFRLGLDKLQ